jgi:hypothetical protein
MTAQTPAYLKARFENGDVPVAADYEDVFDSYLNVATSGVQTLVGGLVSTNFIQASEINSPYVSAASVIASFVSAQTINAGFITCSTVSAATVSANSITVNTVSANTVYVASAMQFGCVNVSAVATTQAGAILVDAPMSFVIFADGNNNSVILPASVRGREQKIINASSTVIKIFPAVSGRFLVTAVNASLSIGADRCATVFHQGNDRYGILVG